MKKLWISFAVVLVVSFAVLGWIGTRIYQEMPPIPDQVVATDGTGRHRQRRYRPRTKCLAVAGRHGGGLHLGTRQLRRAGLDRRLAAPRSHVRPRRLVLQGFRQAVRATRRRRPGQAARPPGRHSTAPTPTTPPPASSASTRCARAPLKAACSTTPDVFINGHDAYAIPEGSVSSPERMRQFAAFIFWTSWTRRHQAARTTSSPTPTTGRTSRWSATGPPAKA